MKVVGLSKNIMVGSEVLWRGYIKTPIGVNLRPHGSFLHVKQQKRNRKNE